MQDVIILPVLWMTSFSHNGVNWVGIKDDAYVLFNSPFPTASCFSVDYMLII